MHYLLYGLLAFFGGSAQLPAQGQTIDYDFDQPELLAQLPKRLDEISGLSLSPRDGELIAVQDENGYFFRLDLHDGQLLGATEFWKDGDYEGVEAVGEDIWVVKSTGTLYQIHRPGTADQEVTKFNGFLESDNDVEGLAYDRKNNRLLLACKSHYGEVIETRSVFAFDLAKSEFVTRPVFTLGRKAMSTYLQSCPHSLRHDEITDFIDGKDKFKLGPSAIAVQPLTGNLFIASSAGKLIIVISPAGKILHIRRLDKDLYPQPEGLAFTADGTLYVSTEARDDEPARIFRLTYQPGFTGL